MNSTIRKTVKASTMEILFEQAKTISIRYYFIKSKLENLSIDMNKKYKYEITVRHPEDTDASKLFDYEVALIEGGKMPTPKIIVSENKLTDEQFNIVRAALDKASDIVIRETFYVFIKNHPNLAASIIQEFIHQSETNKK